MLYLLLALVGMTALIVYVLVIFREVPGAVSERWGELERLPDNLGEWTLDVDSSEALAASARGQSREVRLWRDPGGGWFARDRLVRQVRYKNHASGEIESIDPDVPIVRRRVKAPRG